MVASELKMNFLYNNLYTPYIYPQSIMFEFLNSCIIITCDKYFKIVVNVPLTLIFDFDSH
jgi:hypothetical protein